MSSTVPIHARNHRPGGVDPIPGVGGGGVPVDDEIQDDVDQGEQLDLNSHWFRFREAAYVYSLGNPATTQDVGHFDIGSDGSLEIASLNPFEEEVKAQQPGPNPDSIAARRIAEDINTVANPGNHWRWSNGWEDISGGAGDQVSVAGWFKFTDELGTYHVFNWGTEPYTSLTRVPGGTLTVTREGVSYSATGVAPLNSWLYIALTIGRGRLRLYVNPTAAEPVAPSATIGTDFPFPGPLAMETWGLENGNYTAAELATRLTNAGFETVAVQLNGTPAPGRDHGDYITQLTADVATLQAAGLTVVGWGVVDATTGADLAASGVTGWMPQVEGPGQRTDVIAALGAGVGSGMPKAVVTNYGGLDTPTDVAALASAGITSALVEAYADDGHPDVNVILAAGQSYGFPIDEMAPVVGTYRNETPGSYRGLDADVVPNYGIYNIPQTSDAAWTQFGALNGDTVEWTNPVIDQPDPATTPNIDGMGFSIGESFYPTHIPDGGGALRGYFTEVFVCEWVLPGDRLRAQYLAGAYGDTVPPNESIPVGSIRPDQIQPGAEGQVLKTVGGTVVWEDP